MYQKNLENSQEIKFKSCLDFAKLGIVPLKGENITDFFYRANSTFDNTFKKSCCFMFLKNTNDFERRFGIDLSWVSFNAIERSGILTYGKMSVCDYTNVVEVYAPSPDHASKVQINLPSMLGVSDEEIVFHEMMHVLRGRVDDIYDEAFASFLMEKSKAKFLVNFMSGWSVSYRWAYVIAVVFALLGHYIFIFNFFAIVASVGGILTPHIVGTLRIGSLRKIYRELSQLFGAKYAIVVLSTLSEKEISESLKDLLGVLHKMEHGGDARSKLLLEIKGSV
ncbi:MAG: hypothetical protein KAH32_02440 [Chlamydiia bacterium]|nr:hypothetical protein [Chlamydiia bacterium]